LDHTRHTARAQLAGKSVILHVVLHLEGAPRGQKIFSKLDRIAPPSKLMVKAPHLSSSRGQSRPAAIANRSNEERLAMRKILLSAAGCAAALLAATPSHADITGSIDAGCIINGVNFSDGASGADFGFLDFGTQNTLFTEADGEVLSGGSAFTIQCSPGITPILSFDAGENDGDGAGSGLRAMAHGSTAGQFVTYNLYSDAGRTAVIPIGGDITLSSSGAAQTVNVYGRAFGEAALVPGTYGDVVTVLLEL
jgi:spore coat protein U-like protein